MFSLASIQRMNNAVEATKALRRAQALNAKNKKHPKNAEKTGKQEDAFPLTKMSAEISTTEDFPGSRSS